MGNIIQRALEDKSFLELLCVWFLHLTGNLVFAASDQLPHNMGDSHVHLKALEW